MFWIPAVLAFSIYPIPQVVKFYVYTNGKLKGTSAARRASRRGARSEILGAPRRELRQNETLETPIIMTLSANIKDILSNTPSRRH